MLPGILTILSTRFDSAIGTDQLKPALRKQLLFEQIHGIAQMTPATSSAAFVISLLLLAMASSLPIFPALLIWASALYIALFVAMRGWVRRRGRGREHKRVPSRRAVRAALLNAASFGVLWGALPILLLPTGEPLLTTITCIVMAGVLFATALALLILPQAAIAFSVPLLLGLFASVVRLENETERLTLTVLLVVYTVVMVFVCMRHARNLVHHLVSEARIREQDDIISLLLREFEANTSDWLWECDRHGRLQRVSDRFVAVAEMERGQLVGRDFLQLLTSLGEPNNAVLTELKQAITRRETFTGVELQVLIGGVQRVWRLTGKPTSDDFSADAGYIGTASDVTVERNSERRINYLAHNDALTGLLNRTKFTEHLKQSVARLERYGSPFAVLYLDLDQFKPVNDSRGHLVGDKLLVQVGRRIKAVLRETDMAARLGGDEFAVILNSNCDVSHASALAHRLVEAIEQSYEIDNEFISIGVSIGIAMAPANGNRADQILRNADLALYRAKAEGRGTYRFFESKMDADLRERRLLEFELRQALAKGEFVLHYQPLVSAEDHRPSGFEALARWNHPIRGLVPPSDFIPIAEQTGLIKQIGDWTIHEACHAAMRWPDASVVAVNLSAKHFQMSDISAVVREALAVSGLEPQRLELEITESVLIDNPDDAIARLIELKALGVMIAMDDFGTGYSSLSTLMKFPLDKIKIDRSFVMASSDDEVARDVLRSIASLGKTLKLRITAEGVETKEQVEFLREIACSDLQGFYFAKPLDEAELATYFFTRLDFVPRGAAADWDASGQQRLAG